MATTSKALPLLAARGSDGVHLIQGQDNFKILSDLFSDNNAKGRVMCFSDDGSYFAYTTGQHLKVMDMNDGTTVFEVPKQKTISVKFSPKNTFLACWEPFYTSPQFPNGINNYDIYNIKTNEAVRSMMHKKQTAWEPKWTSDELVCGRCVSNEVQFYEKNDLNTTAKKLCIQGINDFSISPSPSPPYMVAAYVAGKKGAPSFVRLFQYPNFGEGQAVTNKSFFKADKVDMLWNKKGTGLLVLVSAEVDASGSTYYGEQSLHFLSSKGESSLVPFDKRGPIYSVEWNPNSSHFCVVFGFMPAKATLFNMKAEPIFDFGTGPRSICSYNAHGNILSLAGFGNLPGMIEMWNVDGKKLISKMQARDTTFFQWCPDGQHFLTATCAPRLRVGNGYKIWHYTGTEVAKFEVAKNSELFEAIWQNHSPESFPVPRISAATHQEVKQQAYRPPSARGTPQKKLTLHEDELPQNQRNQAMSANALKNKKKREAKAKAKQNEQTNIEPPTSTATSNARTSASAPDVQSTGDPEKDKKIKGLKKKLRQIEDLKTKQKEGKQLEKNQLDKINSEKDLLAELSALQVS